MSIGREAIYSAFFAQISAILLSTATPPGPLQYMGRRPITESSLQQEQYPAGSFLEMGEIYDRSVLFAPAKVSLLANLSIISFQGEVPDETNVTVLNNLADAVEDAIQSACISTAQNVLGGLVQEAWINHRQLVIVGSYPQRISKQVFSIEMVLPHSR
jgi:hypothetical protein